MTTESKKVDPWDRIQATWKNIKAVGEACQELHYGLKHDIVPWEKCTAFFVVTTFLITLRWDIWLLKQIHLAWLYPFKWYLYYPYLLMAASTGFWIWAWNQVRLKKEMANRLTEAFTNAGLKNRIGKTPTFLSLDAIDGQSKKLKVSSAGFPKADFEKSKSVIESALQVYIDEIKEHRQYGQIEINFSYTPMPSLVKMDDINSFPNFQFMVGKTRTKSLIFDLSSIPHILVGGPTTKGKSTFLRQLITTFYLNNKTSRFFLIDLKGGMEFRFFKRLPRIEIVPGIKEAVQGLARLDHMLNQRMKFLEASDCKDIDAYYTLPDAKKSELLAKHGQLDMNRYITVIDEVAELFLASDKRESKDVAVAKKVVSRIARMGRAVGLNLVVATQKPDARALDPQVRSNLIGALCLPMLTDAASISILGNGRATDLPPYPGRAIWKDTSEMVEVQTPLLTEQDAEPFLAPFRLPKETESTKPVPIVSEKRIKEADVFDADEVLQNQEMQPEGEE